MGDVIGAEEDNPEEMMEELNVRRDYDEAPSPPTEEDTAIEAAALLSRAATPVAAAAAPKKKSVGDITITSPGPCLPKIQFVDVVVSAPTITAAMGFWRNLMALYAKEGVTGFLPSTMWMNRVEILKKRHYRAAMAHLCGPETAIDVNNPLEVWQADFVAAAMSPQGNIGEQLRSLLNSLAKLAARRDLCTAALVSPDPAVLARRTAKHMEYFRAAMAVACATGTMQVFLGGMRKASGDGGSEDAILQLCGLVGEPLGDIEE